MAYRCPVSPTENEKVNEMSDYIKTQVITNTKYVGMVDPSVQPLDLEELCKETYVGDTNVAFFISEMGQWGYIRCKAGSRVPSRKEIQELTPFPFGNNSSYQSVAFARRLSEMTPSVVKLDDENSVFYGFFDPDANPMHINMMAYALTGLPVVGPCMLGFGTWEKGEHVDEGETVNPRNSIFQQPCENCGQYSGSHSVEHGACPYDEWISYNDADEDEDAPTEDDGYCSMKHEVNDRWRFRSQDHDEPDLDEKCEHCDQPAWTHGGGMGVQGCGGKHHPSQVFSGSGRYETPECG